MIGKIRIGRKYFTGILGRGNRMFIRIHIVIIPNKIEIESRSIDTSFLVPCCDVRYDFLIKRCSVRLYLQLFVAKLKSYLRYLCLFGYSGVHHILFCVFCFACLRLVCSILSVSLDCPFLIAPSIYSNSVSL
jgi:hypothetical protein